MDQGATEQGTDSERRHARRRRMKRPVRLAASLAVVLGVAAAVAACEPTPVTCGGRTATIAGTVGNDTLVGTEGDDVIAGLGGNDAIRGLGGNDVICGDADVAGSDAIDGGLGNDWVSYDQSLSGGPLDLAAGTAQVQGTDTLTGIENVQGSPAADTLRGDAAANRFILEGSDTVEGRNGNDVFDAVPGCAGGASCNISLSYESAPAAVTVDVNGRTATGGAGNDTYSFTPFALLGSAFGDTLTCATTADRCDIYAGGGADVLTGTPGDDILGGGLGNDRITGSGGVDWVAFETTPAVTVNLAAGTATGQGSDTLVGIHGVYGTSGADGTTAWSLAAK